MCIMPYIDNVSTDYNNNSLFSNKKPPQQGNAVVGVVMRI